MRIDIGRVSAFAGAENRRHDWFDPYAEHARWGRPATYRHANRASQWFGGDVTRGVRALLCGFYCVAGFTIRDRMAQESFLLGKKTMAGLAKIKEHDPEFLDEWNRL